VINSSENKKEYTDNNPFVPLNNFNSRNDCCCCNNILENKFIGTNEVSNSNKLDLDNNNKKNYGTAELGLMTRNKELCGYGACNELACAC